MLLDLVVLLQAFVLFCGRKCTSQRGRYGDTSSTKDILKWRMVFGSPHSVRISASQSVALMSTIHSKTINDEH